MRHLRLPAAPFLLFALFFLAAGPARAAEYHVDPEGSDGASGDASAPFRTIQHAADTAQPGDRVIVHAGTYYERVVVPASGAEGLPIRFEGERAGDGSWLTILDGSEPASGWVPADEVGAGVFKTTGIAYAPYCMMTGDRDIPRLSWGPGTDYDMFNYLPLPDDHMVVTQYLEMEVSYWDGIEALYGHNEGTTYLRFRGGDDPSSMDIRVSPQGAGFTLDGRSHIVVSGFHIRGCQVGVSLDGAGTEHNIVENNHIMNGQARVVIGDGAAFNHVRNNRMEMGRLSDYAPGAWSGGTEYSRGICEHIYNVYKHEVGRGTWSPDDDRGVDLRGAGEGNEVYGNDIFDSLGAVMLTNVSDVRVYGNEIHAMSSGCILVAEGVRNGMIHDNLVYDCSMNMRFHELNSEIPREVYVFRNRFYQPGNVGSHSYWHWATETATPSYFPEIYIYHNSYAGGSTVFAFSAWAPDNGGVPSAWFINNVLSGRRPWSYASNIGIFDYNWVGGTVPDPAEWYGADNITADGEAMWDPASLPDFYLPEGSPARESGIDLSRPFTIDGETHDPLPGMEPGYFAFSAPDRGAVQHGFPDEEEVEDVVEPSDEVETAVEPGPDADAAPDGAADAVDAGGEDGDGGESGCGCVVVQ